MRWENSFLNNWRQWAFRDGRLPWNNRNIALFIFFLAISSGFWLLNALRKTYVTDIVFSIEYYNVPDGKLLVDRPNNTINLKVKGAGFTLLRYQLGREFYPLSIDVSKMRPYLARGIRGAYIEPRDLFVMVSSQLSSDLDLLEVKPDTLLLGFQKKTQKKVPVVFDGVISFAQPFYQSGPIALTPDSIELSGPGHLIDTIRIVRTIPCRREQIKEPVRLSLSLNLPQEVIPSQKTVEAIVPVESFTEASFDVPLLVRGNKPGVVLKTFPAEVRITCRIGLSRYEKIGSSSFVAVVDLNGIDLNSQNRLKVKIEKMPDYIYAVDYSPLFVDFLIEKY